MLNQKHKVMKVNKLQIGDYVNYHGQFIKVTSLYDKGGSNEVGWSNKESVWVNADNVEPIPLTAEILEKNGFIKNAYKDDRLIDVFHLLVPTGFERESFTIQVSLYREPICGVSTLVKCWGGFLRIMEE